MNWIVHIILLILGQIWSKGSNLTSLPLVNVFAEVAKVNTEALNIKSYQPRRKHCRRSAEAKYIFISLPRDFICRGKKCLNSRAGCLTLSCLSVILICQYFFFETLKMLGKIIFYHFCLKNLKKFFTIGWFTSQYFWHLIPQKNIPAILYSWLKQIQTFPWLF